MNIKEFEELPVLGILRGITYDMISPLVKCAISSGLKSIEITMNTENAPELIKQTKKEANGLLSVGAGTVLTLEEMEQALTAGASFIVMPVIVEDIVVYCTANNIPVFPGALTANEIYYAWKLGATMVKVFPAKAFGPGYFKEIKAPLDNIKLMATGGVSADNVNEYIKNGANALSFGASIFKKNWLENAEYDKIEAEIKKLINNYLQAIHC